MFSYRSIKPQFFLYTICQYPTLHRAIKRLDSLHTWKSQFPIILKKSPIAMPMRKSYPNAMPTNINIYKIPSPHPHPSIISIHLLKFRPSLFPFSLPSSPFIPPYQLPLPSPCIHQSIKSNQPSSSSSSLCRCRLNRLTRF